jgi:hypothetical protein
MLVLHSGGREFESSDDHVLFFKYRFKIQFQCDKTQKLQCWSIFDLKLQKDPKYSMVLNGNFDNFKNTKKR